MDRHGTGISYSHGFLPFFFLQLLTSQKKTKFGVNPKTPKKFYWETLTVNHGEHDHNRLIVSFQSGATENRTGQIKKKCMRDPPHEPYFKLTGGNNNHNRREPFERAHNATDRQIKWIKLTENKTYKNANSTSFGMQINSVVFSIHLFLFRRSSTILVGVLQSKSNKKKPTRNLVLVCIAHAEHRLERAFGWCHNSPRSENHCTQCSSI